MPTARFYRGRPVKRMYRTDGGIRLIMVSKTSGVAGQRLTITQADWEKDGEVREVVDNSTAGLRKLVR